VIVNKKTMKRLIGQEELIKLLSKKIKKEIKEPSFFVNAFTKILVVDFFQKKENNPTGIVKLYLSEKNTKSVSSQIKEKIQIHLTKARLFKAAKCFKDKIEWIL